MIFSSFLFLCIFLPVVLIINRLLPLRLSNFFLFVVSLLFYFIGEGQLTILLIGSIIWNYLFGIGIENTIKKFTKKIFLGICIAGNLGLLIYYKYFGFLIENLGLEKLISESQYASIVLPIGISFFTFQGISYIMDVYRGVSKVERDPIKLGLYISFFPQLVAGPIIKYNEIDTYLSKREINTSQTLQGAQKFIRGLAKKVVFADNFAIVADLIFETDPSLLPSSIAWLGIGMYSLQIYYDFSGYSDMAIGLGLIMGFKFPENFNYPYISTSIKEFWRRWHISLSTWFKNYLYIPLGGNRKGVGRTYLNLWIVFLITGIWHGANFNFIIWGMMHGFFLLIERAFPLHFGKIPQLIKHIYTLIVVSMSWVFFRTSTFEGAISYFKQLFSFHSDGEYLALMNMNTYMIFILCLGILFVSPIRNKLSNLGKVFSNNELRIVLQNALYLSLLLYCILELSITTHSPFIYFKF